MRFLQFPILALFLGSVFLVTGCQSVDLYDKKTSVFLREQNLSLQELTNFVQKSVPAGVRTISPNGREFLSQYFVIDDKDYIVAKDQSLRYWARMTILNSSRPFDIEVEVWREVRRGEGLHIHYVLAGYDLRLAKVLRDQLKDRLVKRREDFNLLDDFRVF